MGDYWSRDRELRFNRIEAEAAGFGLRIREVNKRVKPWGGFVRFDGESLDAFRRAYWQKGISPYWRAVLAELWQVQDREQRQLTLDSKLLLLEPGKRFSLQAHAQRSELWRVIEGPVLIVLGDDEERLREIEVRPGEVIRIPSRQLHRASAPALHWAILAEFWHHDDPANPSTEDDVIRHADDYDRVGEDIEGD
ncbi:MAG: cupin domain-containing protein [Planctomycetes bacterium]|nr:cupin domain-containing protein [Planctomycetota bacterium]